MRMRAVAAILSLSAGAFVASASSAGAAGDRPQKFCASLAKDLKTDDDLAAAARAVFGVPGFADDAEDCLYPVQTIRYGDVDVLLWQARAPEEGCQSCMTDLNATVLKRVPGGYKNVRTFEAFSQTGGRGGIAAAWPVPIAGDDGLAIENDDWAQGYDFVTLGLYAFRSGGLVGLTPKDDFLIGYDNEGAEADASKVVHVDAAWSIEGGELTIDYRVADIGGKRSARAVWTLGETQATLKSGGPPPEIARARDGG